MKRITAISFILILFIISTGAKSTKENVLGYWEIASIEIKDVKSVPSERNSAFYFYEDGSLEFIHIGGTERLMGSWNLVKGGKCIKIGIDDPGFKKPMKIAEISDQRMVWEVKDGKIVFDRGLEEK